MNAVHPRSCGEQPIIFPTSRRQCGSSPLVRGTVVDADTLGEVTRFIPARAGNRRSHHRPWSCRAVHPRSCGEQATERAGKQINLGSSPLVRGTAAAHSMDGFNFRFIPARAGNRTWLTVAGQIVAVHPRSCGEQCEIIVVAVVGFGSSPLVRGTAFVFDCGKAYLRFIPARAGNSIKFYICPHYKSVHPRSCGEQMAKMAGIPIFIGSSPLVRGTDFFYFLKIIEQFTH